MNNPELVQLDTKENYETPKNYEGTSLEILEYFRNPENNKMLEGVLYSLYYSFYEKIKNSVEIKGQQNLRGADRFLAAIINILEDKEQNELLESIEPYQKLFIILTHFLNSLTVYTKRNPKLFRHKVEIPDYDHVINTNNSLVGTNEQPDLFKVLAKASTLIQSYMLIYDKMTF
jgi:hypothetical protein